MLKTGTHKLVSVYRFNKILFKLYHTYSRHLNECVLSFHELFCNFYHG